MNIINSKSSFLIYFIFFFILFEVLPVCPTEIRITPPDIFPGDVVLIEVVNTSSKPTCQFNDRNIPFYLQTNKVYRCLIGIPCTLPPDKYRLFIYHKGEKKSFVIVIKKKDFPVREIRLSKNKQAILKKPEVKNETKVIKETVKVESKKKFFYGKFILPVEGKISSEYGVRRYLNKRFLWAHKGVDIVCPVGTIVKSSNTGKVILVKDDFLLYGKTVIINHGQGVYSIYLHLSKVKVEEDNVVEKGDVIGYSGSSGLSTGPHLHWGIYLHGVAVDPLNWIERKY